MNEATVSAVRACARALWIAGLITLAITVLRVVGEVNQWAPLLFARSAGGGAGLVGIGWLIPAVGFWFGRTLARRGHEVGDRARALRRCGLGLLGVAVTLALGRFVLPVTVGTFAFVLVALAACSPAAFAAWPALARVLLVYALLARLPTVLVTILAVANDWGTHYERLAPGSAPMSDGARTLVLCAAQFGIWIPLTLLLGSLAGTLAGRSRLSR
jgi:hypothetical protein